MNVPTFSKTRIAPTPSGYLHLGNVLSFSLTATLAHQTGAKILLRIDDLDRDRVQREYVEDIFNTLDFLEIPYEGPRNFEEYQQEWSQIHRMANYNKALQILKENGDVFACECSRAQIRYVSADDSYPGTCLNKNIPLDAANVSWRLKTDSNQLINVKSISGEISQAKLPDAMHNFVVRKKDGYPAYQLTSILDDLHYGVDLIVRGADLWDSTLAQLYLAPKIGAATFADTAFYHHPLLAAPGGTKLSKSAGDISVQYLRKEGKKPLDIFTAIAGMLGSGEPVKNWQGLTKLLLSEAF